ncbi:MAG: 1-acyl-sn-glycerol-3-phosphate acyltransferase [Rhodospirillaceae bacterium]|nr:1-acyl-sn-glycerol-3-phosphate acyltransferase [Rhodospirillaceae bacterium]
MIVLRSLIFNVVFFGGTTVFAIAMLPTLILPRRALVVSGKLWSRRVVAMLRLIVGMRVEIRGREHIPQGGALVAAKHQSALDTIVMPMILDDAACALKRELIFIPVYGWYLLKARQIVIDRSGRARALKRLVHDAAEAIAAGRPVVIFPQGTRVAPGEDRPYLPGLMAIYARLGQPVTPVAVSSGLFWGRRSFIKRPGTVVFEFLPPIPSDLGRAAFAEALETRIESATSALAREAESRAETGPFIG